MTNRERLISLLGFTPANKEAVDAELIDIDIDGSQTYTPSNSIPLKTAAISLMKLILSMPDTTNADGMITKFDRSAIVKRIAQLEDEIGVTTIDRPRIQAKKMW